MELRLDEYIHDNGIHGALLLINMLQNQNIEFDSRVLCRISHMDVSNMSYIEQILITRHITNVYNQLAYSEQYFCRCKTKWNRSKQLYENHVKIGVRLLTLTYKFGKYLDNRLFVFGNFYCILMGTTDILETFWKKQEICCSKTCFLLKNFWKHKSLYFVVQNKKKVWCLTSKFDLIQYLFS